MTLEDRVAEQFAKHDDLRVLFHFDPDGDVQNEVEAWDHDEITCVVAETARFRVLRRLERDLRDTSVFLYVPEARPTSWEDEPLASVYVANRELRIDRVAELMDDLDLDRPHRGLIQRYYDGELEYKNRRTFLGGMLQNNQLSERTLKMGLAAYHAADVFDDVRFRSAPRDELVLAAVMVGATRPDAFESYRERCKELELGDLLARQLSRQFDHDVAEFTLEAVRDLAQVMKYNLLVRLIDDLRPDDPYRKLRIESPLARNQVISLANAWRDSGALDARLEDTLDALAPEVQEEKLVDVYGPDTTFGYMTPTLRRRRIEQAAANLPEQPSRAREIVNDLRNDETPEAEAAEAIWQMAAFYRLVDQHQSLDFGSPEAFVERYSSDLCRADTSYRQAVQAVRTLRQERPDLESTLQAAYSRFLDDYHERFVHPLNTNWQQALEQHVADGKEVAFRTARSQGGFYDRYVGSAGQKTAVIISDALRYEAAQTLADRLGEDARNQVDLAPTLGALPSITSLGMAHLLPHDAIASTDDGAFEIDGISTSGVQNRERILQTHDAEARALPFDEVRAMNTTEGRELAKGHDCLYIYHDRIDAIGDNRRTERDVVPAIETAVDEIQRLIKTLNNWNYRRVVVTADHGFLYSESDLPDSMVERLPDLEGSLVQKNRVVVAEEAPPDIGYRFPIRAVSSVDADLHVVVPRAVNRYRRRGAGKQYAHGGASLQEMVVPALVLKKAREDVADKVDVRLLSEERTIRSGALSARLLQTEAVSETHQPRTIHAALYDDEDNIVSDTDTFTLDARASDATERTQKLILTLKPEANQLNFCQLKIYDEDDTNRLNPLIDQRYSIQRLIEQDF